MKALLKAALILAAVGYVYFPAWRGEWLWDDIEELAQNALVRDPHALGRIWFAPPGLDYYPLKTTVQWLVWQLGGGRGSYHLLNAALQGGSALLLWRLFSKLGLRQAWWGGLLFAVHPLCVESVAWMAELKNTLSLPPLLLAACAYVDFDPGLSRLDSGARPGRPYGWAVFWFLVSLLAKTAGVMFPASVLLYVWWRRGRVTRRDLAAVLPFLALALLLGAVTLWLQEHRSIGTAVVVTGAAASRWAVAGVVGAFYLCKSVWPAGLLPIYPRWPVDPVGAVQFLPWLALGGGLGWMGVRKSVGSRAVLFGVGFFFLNLLPVLGFVPISHMRFAWAMDHLAYLPLLGLVGVVAAGLDRLGRARGVIAATLVAVLAATSHAAAGRYARSLDLWSYAAERNPQAWLAQYNWGVALEQAGRSDEARSRYEATIRLRPAYPEAHLNLGNLLERRGERAAAIAQYRLGLKFQPDYPEAENNLCQVLLETGAVGEAIGHGERAVRLRPSFAEAQVNVGNALLRARQIAAALEHFRAAVRLRPSYAEAHNGLGAGLAYAGHYPAAVAEFQTAIRLDPALNSARDNLRRLRAVLNPPGRAAAP